MTDYDKFTQRLGRLASSLDISIRVERPESTGNFSIVVDAPEFLGDMVEQRIEQIIEQVNYERLP